MMIGRLVACGGGETKAKTANLLLRAVRMMAIVEGTLIMDVVMWRGGGGLRRQRRTRHPTEE